MLKNITKVNFDNTLDFGITKQSSVLSYMDIYLYLGLLFLFCIPFILLVKKGKNKVDMSEAMH